MKTHQLEPFNRLVLLLIRNALFGGEGNHRSDSRERKEGFLEVQSQEAERRMCVRDR
jgi:hypothetical protein